MTNIIPESELILNHRQAVYHLDLLPEEIAHVVLTVGDPNRVATVSQYFDSIEVKRSHREFVTHTGRIGAKRVSVISTGIGTDNIDIVLNELDALVNIDLKTRVIRPHHTPLQIIRLGTTGGLQPFLDTGSLVITNGAFGLDNLLAFYKYEVPEDAQSVNDAFQKHIAQLAPSYFFWGGKNEVAVLSTIQGAHTGFTVTCSGFYGPQGRQLRLPPLFSDFAAALQTFDFENQKILNFEMETSGIFGLGKLLGHQCCSVSVVVANRITQKFSNNPEQDVNNMIEKTLAHLSDL